MVITLTLLSAHVLRGPARSFKSDLVASMEIAGLVSAKTSLAWSGWVGNLDTYGFNTDDCACIRADIMVANDCNDLIVLLLKVGEDYFFHATETPKGNLSNCADVLHNLY